MAVLLLLATVLPASASMGTAHYGYLPALTAVAGTCPGSLITLPTA